MQTIKTHRMENILGWKLVVGIKTSIGVLPGIKHTLEMEELVTKLKNISQIGEVCIWLTVVRMWLVLSGCWAASGWWATLSTYWAPSKATQVNVEVGTEP